MNGEYLSIDTINHIADLEQKTERLNKGYCELKEKCNRGECDCTKEEYNSICEANIKLYLEVDKLNKIIKIKTNRIQDLMKRLSKRTDKVERLNNIIGKVIGLIYDYQMNDEENENYKELLYVLKGRDKN